MRFNKRIGLRLVISACTKNRFLMGLVTFGSGLKAHRIMNLALRCTERSTREQIVHIPRVLYHWRIHRGSTAHFESNAKPYAYIAGERAINESLSRKGIAGQAEALIKQRSYRVHYELPAPSPLVSLIVPTRNGRALVRRVIDLDVLDGDAVAMVFRHQLVPSGVVYDPHAPVGVLPLL